MDLSYKSAMDSICCLIRSCREEDKEKIINNIRKEFYIYDEKWCRANGMPTQVELMHKIISDIEKRKKRKEASTTRRSKKI